MTKPPMSIRSKLALVALVLVMLVGVFYLIFPSGLGGVRNKPSRPSENRIESPKPAPVQAVPPAIDREQTEGDRAQSRPSYHFQLIGGAGDNITGTVQIRYKPNKAAPSSYEEVAIEEGRFSVDQENPKVLTISMDGHLTVIYRFAGDEGEAVTEIPVKEAPALSIRLTDQNGVPCPEGRQVVLVANEVEQGSPGAREFFYHNEYIARTGPAGIAFFSAAPAGDAEVNTEEFLDWERLNARIRVEPKPAMQSLALTVRRRPRETYAAVMLPLNQLEGGGSFVGEGISSRYHIEVEGIDARYRLCKVDDATGMSVIVTTDDVVRAYLVQYVGPNKPPRRSRPFDAYRGSVVPVDPVW